MKDTDKKKKKNESKVEDKKSKELNIKKKDSAP